MDMLRLRTVVITWSISDKMISEMVGKQTIDMETYNITRGASGSTTRNRQLVERDLIQPAEVGRLPRDKAILLMAGSDPVMDEKYTADRHPNWDEVAGHDGSKHGLYE